MTMRAHVLEAPVPASTHVSIARKRRAYKKRAKDVVAVHMADKAAKVKAKRLEDFEATIHDAKLDAADAGSTSQRLLASIAQACGSMVKEADLVASAIAGAGI